jgi:hypothetical protein
MPTHHAAAYIGDIETAHATARDAAFEILGRELEGSPDYQAFVLETFGIDESRLVKERAVQTPVGDMQVLVVVAHTYTIPAQNALLKVLEEPPQGTVLLLVATSEHDLLKTVRSRVPVTHVGGVGIERTYDALGFVSMSVADRLAYVERFHKPEKDRVQASVFLRELAEVLHDSLQNSTEREQAQRQLKAVVEVEQYVLLPSSSPKLLLEHLATTL